MRSALTALLILSLLGGQVGMLGALLGRYHAQQQKQHEVAAVSESPSLLEDLQHLTIPRVERQSSTSSFVRVEEHEFRYQGNLYDVVYEEWRGDVLHAWVLHDREEEQYLDALAQAMDTSMLEESTVPGQQRPVGYRPLAVAPNGPAPLPSPLVRSQSFPRVSVADHQAPYLEVPHPPPWA